VNAAISIVVGLVYGGITFVFIAGAIKVVEWFGR